MADVTGNVFWDKAANGVKDPGDPGLPGRVVRIVNTGLGTIASVLTDSAGNYSIDLGGSYPGGVNTISSIPFSGWVDFTGGVVLTSPPEVINFAHTVTTPPEEGISLPPSSWIRWIGWIPDQFLGATFPHPLRQLKTVGYPGSTYDDYIAIQESGSPGRVIQNFYRRRPYVELGLRL